MQANITSLIWLIFSHFSQQRHYQLNNVELQKNAILENVFIH